MKEIVLFGASGFLGRNLLWEWKDSSNKIHALVRDQSFSFQNYKFSKFSEWQSILTQIDASKAVVINCAAMADVPKCHHHPEEAESINHLWVQELGSFCKERQLPLIHISTDGIFPAGKSSSPNYWKPEDQPAPVSVYGKTKYRGELTLQKLDWGKVIRTTFVGSGFGTERGLIDYLAQQISKKAPINGYTDNFFSPIHTKTFSQWLVDYQITSPRYEILHWGSDSALTKGEYLLRVLERAEIYQPMTFITRDISQVPAPLDQSLTCQKTCTVQELIKLSAESLRRDLGVKAI